MSPEQQKATPENQQEKPYVTEVHSVIAKASESHPETTDSFSAVDSHVDKILHDADNGEITGSAGTYTREQLLVQLEDFIKELNTPVEKRTEKNPYAYVPGKDGLRASFRMLMDNPVTSKNFEQSIKMHIEAHKEKRAELLSPENIQEMGEVELIAAEVNEPMVEARRAARGMIEVPDFGKKSSEATPLEIPAAPQEGSEKAPETEAEMYERFSRESQAELRDLYAQHRAAVPGSQEAATLENQIRNTKEDVGTYARKASRLKGNTNWH